MAGAIAKAKDPLTVAKRQSYEGFTQFVLWGTIFVVAVVALLGIFVA